MINWGFSKIWDGSQGNLSLCLSPLPFLQGKTHLSHLQSWYKSVVFASDGEDRHFGGIHWGGEDGYKIGGPKTSWNPQTELMVLIAFDLNGVKESPSGPRVREGEGGFRTRWNNCRPSCFLLSMKWISRWMTTCVSCKRTAASLPPSKSCM